MIEINTLVIQEMLSLGLLTPQWICTCYFGFLNINNKIYIDHVFASLTHSDTHDACMISLLTSHTYIHTYIHIHIMM